jgi:Methyltransferase domain
MTVSQHPPLRARIVLKLKRIVRELDRGEREWIQAWPLIQPIEGWLYGGQERWLFDSARSLSNGSNIVEIGSYKGRSTCSLGFGCRGTQKRVFAIDRFDGGPDLPRADTFQDFSRNVEQCGLSEYIVPIVASSTDVARTWRKPIHLLFVDGSHKYEDVVADFVGFFPHVVSGGIVAFHDVETTWPGVLQAWNDVVRGRLTSLGNCHSLAYGSKP